MRAINLCAIDASLRKLQRVFPEVNQKLFDRRDSLDDDVIERMLKGYALVDRFVTDRTDMFAMGQLSHWLQLNAVALCGDRADASERYRGLLQATETRFYEERDGGIRDVMDWYALNQNKSVWYKAAGVYNRILSEPQLFIEGNHRTGALIISYILVREGQPPFVLTENNAQGFFDPSSVIRKVKKRNLIEQLKFRRLTRAFSDFLEAQSNFAFLASAKK